MANANRPTGLSPVRSTSGEFDAPVNVYSIAGNYNSAVAIGDPVKSTGTASADGYAEVNLAAAGEIIRGVVVGLGRYPTMVANPGNLDITYRPAQASGPVWYALVADDPNTIFEVQMATCAALDVGANADLVAGANNGFVSGYTLSGTAAAGAAQCRILGLVPRQDNAFGAFAKVTVKIMEHELTTLAGI